MNKDTDSKNKNDFYFFTCPHCQGGVQVLKKDINCKIFRHGIYKDSNQIINPHASKVVCDELILNNKIYGCGRPIYFDGLNVTVCDYK